MTESETTTLTSLRPSVESDLHESDSDVSARGLTPPRSPVQRRESTPPCLPADQSQYLPSPPSDVARLMPDVDQEELARGVQSVIRFKW